MEMYRVSYGTRSWWTSVPQIEKREVIKKTEKTVLFKSPRTGYADGEYKVVGFEERRESLASDGVRWFDNESEAKAFMIADQEQKLKSAEKRVVCFRENLEKLRSSDA